MGNSGAKAKDGGVKKRTKKVGKRDNRPLSDPGELSMSPTGEAQQHGLRRVGSEDLTGRNYYDPSVNFAPNPTQRQGSRKQPSVGPGLSAGELSGTSALANEAVVSMYRKRLDAVLAVWPELAALNDVDLRSLRASAVDALHTLYKYASDENQEAEALQRQKVELAEKAGQLEKRLQRHVDELRRKDSELEALDREVKVLTGELRRRGIEPRFLEREGPPPKEEPPSDYDSIPGGQPPIDTAAAASTTGAGGAASAAGGAKQDGEEDAYSLQRKKNKSMYVATPMLLAEGSKGLGVALQRTQSLRSGEAGGAAATRDIRSPNKETSRMVEDLNQRVRSLQLELDDERRRKTSLQNKLESLEARGATLASYASGSGPTVDTVRAIYDDLEGQALSRVVTTVYKVLGRVTHSDIMRFVCDTMMFAFVHASEQYERFEGTLHALLTSPVHHDFIGSDHLNSSHNSKRLSDNIQRFEQGISPRGGSRLAQRTRVTSELPSHLEEEVKDFIRLTSDAANVDDLSETVSEHLRRRWPNCSGVADHSCFTDFLQQCCHLAWQLNTMSPPCHLTIDDPMRYDERLHDVLPVQAASRPTIGATIDYYAWPILYKKKHGEILYRGRVALVLRM